MCRSLGEREVQGHSVLVLGPKIKLGLVGAAVERKLLREKLGDCEHCLVV